MLGSIYHVRTATGADDPAYDVQLKDWNSGHAFTLQLQTSDVSNANGVTLGVDTNGVLTGSVKTDYAGTGLSITGGAATLNTAGLAINISGRVGLGTTITGNLSVTADSNGLQINAGGLAGTATSVTGAAAITLNSNGIAFNGASLAGTGYTRTTVAGTSIGATLGTNGLSLAQPNFLTNNQISAGTTNQAISNWSFADGSGVSWGLNVRTITASVKTDYLTGAVGFGTTITGGAAITLASAGIQFNGVSLAGTGFSGTNISGTVDSNGISLSVAAPGGGGAIMVSGGTTSGNVQTLVFPNANGVSFQLNGSTISASVNTSYRASNDAVGLNTAQSNVTWTVNSGGISLDGRGYMGTDTAITGGSMTGNSAGLSINIPPQTTGSYYRHPQFWPNLSSGAGPYSASVSLMGLAPFNLEMPLSASYLRMPFAWNGQSSSGGTSANTSISATINNTFNFVLYTLGTGGSSRSLLSYTSGSAGLSQAWSLTANANGSEWTLSYNITYPIEGGTSSFSTSTAVSQTRFDFSTNPITNFTGNRGLDIPAAFSLPPNAYWLGINMRSARAGDANLQLLMVQPRPFSVSVTNVALNKFGVATNSSNQINMGLGSYSTNSAGPFTGIPLSVVSSSNLHLPFELIRQA